MTSKKKERESPNSQFHFLHTHTRESPSMEEFSDARRWARWHAPSSPILLSL